MSDTPKKTLSLKRSQPSIDSATPATVQRTGKRIIRREELSNVQKPGTIKQKLASNKGKPKKPPRKPQPKKPVIAPSDLKAKELNDRLNGFNVWLNYQPLALGIEKQIFKLVNDECFPGASKKVVQKVLRRHTQHGRYLAALVQGGERYQLEGVSNGAVSESERQWAVEKITARQS
ncbi:MAG: hypothetical protein RLZZ215_396 [Pseudomonadota bacterium]